MAMSTPHVPYRDIPVAHGLDDLESRHMIFDIFMCSNCARLNLFSGLISTEPASYLKKMDMALTRSPVLEIMLERRSTKATLADRRADVGE